MLKRSAIATILFAALTPAAQAQTVDRALMMGQAQPVARILAISADDPALSRPAETDRSRKAWFDRAVTDILEGRVRDPGAIVPQEPVRR